MFQPPRFAAGGRALLRAALAAALVLPALAPSAAEAQRGRRGPALQLESLQLVELGRARGRHGAVTRWGLSYRRGPRGQQPAQLEVTLERGPNRRLVRHVQLTGRHGTVPIGPARGIPDVSVRALDRSGRPMAIRIGRGQRQRVVTLGAPAPNRRRARPVTTTRVHHSQTRVRTTVDGQRWESDDVRTRRTASNALVEPRRGDSAAQLAAADRACRDAFTGNENAV